MSSTQDAYIRRALGVLEKDTGARPQGWSSPSVSPNSDTVAATAAEGITYSLDGMDCDHLSRLATRSGPSILVPYPAVTVDMGQYLSRAKEPVDLERLWIDNAREIAREAKADPSRKATEVAIGIHPFVAGTSFGTASPRRVLENFKQQKLFRVTDVQAVTEAGKIRLSKIGQSLAQTTACLHGPIRDQPRDPANNSWHGSCETQAARRFPCQENTIMAYRATGPRYLDYTPYDTGSDTGRGIATLNYALYIAGFFTGITAVIGVVLAYLRRGTASPMVRSHLDWQIRIFWHCILAGIAIVVLHALVVALAAITFGVGFVFMVVPWAVGAWWLVWTIWAVVKGLQRLGHNQPIR